MNMRRHHRIRTTLGTAALILILMLAAGCGVFGDDDTADDAVQPDSTPIVVEPTATSSTPPTAISSPTTIPPLPTPTATEIPASPTPTAEPPATETAVPTPPPPAPTATATSQPPPTIEPTSAPAGTATATAGTLPGADDVWNLRQFDTDELVMVLTFDAGADRGYTEEILDILAAEGIQASFGMTGPWAEENPDMLVRIVDDGHHLINHSWSHPHFPELTSEERAAELHRLEDLIRTEVGVEMQPYFRPPFGEYDEATLTDLARNGYTINVMWTVDTLGWNGLSADEINARVMDAAAPGAIVLMHVGIQSQDAVALPEMIRLLREQGYSFATIAELVER